MGAPADCPTELRMLNTVDCQTLRDMLFAMRFDTEESVFELLAVVPGGVDSTDATIHYAYCEAVWERAGRTTDPDAVFQQWELGRSNDPNDYVAELIARTPFAASALAIQCHFIVEQRWPIDWSVTANRHVPEVVLVERSDGSVTGAVMRETLCNTHVHFAGCYVEPTEVNAGIAFLRDLGPAAGLYDWVKECNIDAPSLENALSNSPESVTGHKFVLVYRENEWFWGIWSNPTRCGVLTDSLRLASVSDFHGSRASHAKRESRLGLERVRETAVTGGYATLNSALRLIRTRAVPDSRIHHDYEANSAVKSLCDWWNTVAPAGMREAAAFRVYTWRPNDRSFIAGDPEEPALQVVDTVDYKGHALFETEGEPVVMVWFLRGRRFNTYENGGTMVYCSDGEEAYDVGGDPTDVDEAYYSLVGLERLASDVELRAIANRA